MAPVQHGCPLGSESGNSSCPAKNGSLHHLCLALLVELVQHLKSLADKQWSMVQQQSPCLLVPLRRHSMQQLTSVSPALRPARKPCTDVERVHRHNHRHLSLAQHWVLLLELALPVQEGVPPLRLLPTRLSRPLQLHDPLHTQQALLPPAGRRFGRPNELRIVHVVQQLEPPSDVAGLPSQPLPQTGSAMLLPRLARPQYSTHLLHQRLYGLQGARGAVGGAIQLPARLCLGRAWEFG